MRECDHTLEIGEHLIGFIVADGTTVLEGFHNAILDELKIRKILLFSGDELSKTKVPIP